MQVRLPPVSGECLLVAQRFQDGVFVRHAEVAQGMAGVGVRELLKLRSRSGEDVDEVPLGDPAELDAETVYQDEPRDSGRTADRHVESHPAAKLKSHHRHVAALRFLDPVQVNVGDVGDRAAPVRLRRTTESWVPRSDHGGLCRELLQKRLILIRALHPGEYEHERVAVAQDGCVEGNVEAELNREIVADEIEGLHEMLQVRRKGSLRYRRTTSVRATAVRRSWRVHLLGDCDLDPLKWTRPRPRTGREQLQREPALDEVRHSQPSPAARNYGRTCPPIIPAYVSLGLSAQNAAPRKAQPSRTVVIMNRDHLVASLERLGVPATAAAALPALPDDLDGLVLYGSQARGDAIESSDVDLLALVEVQRPSTYAGDVNISYYTAAQLATGIGTLFGAHLRRDSKVVWDESGALTAAIAAMGEVDTDRLLGRAREMAALFTTPEWDLPKYLAGLVREARYLLRSCLYAEAMAQGAPCFSVRELAARLDDPVLADLLSSRQASAPSPEDLEECLSRLSNVIGPFPHSQSGSLEATVVNEWGHAGDLLSMAFMALGNAGDGSDYAEVEKILL